MAAAWRVDESWVIPLGPGQAVSEGWPAETGGMPRGVTWHWTATATLDECNRLIGGASAVRKGDASAHYGIGRDFAEGVVRYVSLENRSWHAGRDQELRWDGLPAVAATKGARTCIGIETVSRGHAREDVPAGPDWIEAATPVGETCLVEPWTEEQIEMAVAVGREVVARWPHLGPRDHHGHHDLCPIRRQDPVGFPFARVLRGIYGDPGLPDVWSGTWRIADRRGLLIGHGHDPGPGTEWTAQCRSALAAFQRDAGLEPNGLWTSWVCWAFHDMR